MNCHAQALLRHFAAQLGPLEAVEHRDTPWHSATFNGARYCFAFTVGATAKVPPFARTLPEADITLPGGFVADALVASVDGTRLSVEVLTIDAA
jgi:hypothetical protein